MRAKPYICIYTNKNFDKMVWKAREKCAMHWQIILNISQCMLALWTLYTPCIYASNMAIRISCIITTRANWCSWQTLAPKGDTVIQISVLVMWGVSSHLLLQWGLQALLIIINLVAVFKGAELLKRLMKVYSGFQTASCVNCAGCCMYSLYKSFTFIFPFHVSS